MKSWNIAWHRSVRAAELCPTPVTSCIYTHQDRASDSASACISAAHFFPTWMRVVFAAYPSNPAFLPQWAGRGAGNQQNGHNTAGETTRYSPESPFRTRYYSIRCVCHTSLLFNQSICISGQFSCFQTATVDTKTPATGSSYQASPLRYGYQSVDNQS